MRRGVTPVVAVAILMGMAVVAAGGAYTWVTMIQQDTLDDASEQVQYDLAVRDITCRNDRIDITLDNTGGRELSGAAISAYLSHGGDLLADNDTDLSGKAFLEANGVDTATFTFPALMAKNERYTLDIAFTRDDYTFSTMCTADGGFVHGTQYGREVTVTNTHPGDLDGFPASVTLDTATPIGNGKMQAGCADIRVEEDGDPVPYNVTGCNTASTEIHFATDIAASATESDIYLYYGDDDLADGQQRIPSRIINGDFSDGSWTGWSTTPRTPGGSTAFWLDQFPDAATCTTPTDSPQDPCSYPAATIELLSSGRWNATCSPLSGCPTPVLGDGNLSLDSGSDGSGYNGNIRSDSYRVPGDVHLHWWHNLQGRSSDTGRYDSATRWYGTPQSYSYNKGEGIAWALVRDGDADGTFDTDDEILANRTWGGNNEGSNHYVTGEIVRDVSSAAGDHVRAYVESHHSGGGDDSLIQIDDLYWSDASGNEITLSTSLGAELDRP